MFKFLVSILNDEEGASLVEYALIVALISVVAITALKSIGTNASTQLSNAALNI
jgi:Flp pilus assembly pilin Flp